MLICKKTALEEDVVHIAKFSLQEGDPSLTQATHAPDWNILLLMPH